MNDYTFGNFIYTLREQKGYTQADIADMLGVTPAAVSKWENGDSKPRIETLFRLADILGVKAEELIAGHRLQDEKLDPEVVNKIYERYDLLMKVDSGNTTSVKFKRMVAFLLDWNIIGFSVMFLVFFAKTFIDESSYVMSDGAVFLLMGTMLLYPVCVALRDVIFGGRSLGKRIMGLAVADKTTGKKPSVRKLILRDLFFFLMYIDGIVLMVSGKTVGDRVAGTVVVPKKLLEEDCNNKTNFAKIQEINTYIAPKTRNKRNVVLITIAILIAFALVMFIIVNTALNAAKRTEEYHIAYNYLVSSENFIESDLEPEDVRLTGYSTSQNLTVDGATRTTTFTFNVGGRSYEVNLVYKDGTWLIDTYATTF